GAESPFPDLLVTARKRRGGGDRRIPFLRRFQDVVVFPFEVELELLLGEGALPDLVPEWAVLRHVVERHNAPLLDAVEYILGDERDQLRTTGAYYLLARILP